MNTRRELLTALLIALAAPEVAMAGINVIDDKALAAALNVVVDRLVDRVIKEVIPALQAQIVQPILNATARSEARLDGATATVKLVLGQ